MESQASNLPLIYPVISCESMKIFKFFILSSLIIFKPTKRASYLAWLFEALKLNRRTHSIMIPSKLMRMRSAPLSCMLDAPSICSTHADAKLVSEVLIYFDLPSSSFLGLSLDMVQLMTKSAKIYAFIDGCG